jgi:Highly conserved protein containing a thioredoxin domain
MHKALLFSAMLFILIASCDRPQKNYGCYLEETTIGNQRVIEIYNSNVKAKFTIAGGKILQEFFAINNKQWIPIAQSFLPPTDPPISAIKLYNSSLDPANRLITSEILDSIKVVESNKNEIVLELTGNSNGHHVEQMVRLEDGKSQFHIEVSALLAGNSPTLEYLLSPFLFTSSTKPEFIHTPKLKFADDDIFGDRTFYSPAVIMQEKSFFCALVPDLDMINKYMVLSPDARFAATRVKGRPWDLPVDSSRWSMPTGLDYNLKSGLSEWPLFSFGIIDAIATHHMHWPHPNDGSMVRHLRKNFVKYGFDLMIQSDAPRYRGYQSVSRFMWDRYGKKCFQEPKPQVMPFENYAKKCYPASAAYKGWWVGPNWKVNNSAPKGYPDMEAWQQWEMQGWPVGGYKNSAQGWYDMIEFTTWWNNMRDAVGIYWWGKHTSDSSLVDKSRRIVNLILLSPQKNGAFPVIYRAFKKRWQGNHWDPPAKMDSSSVNRYFSDSSQSYQTSAMSKTCAHLLRYYRLCESNQRIIPFAKSYGDFIVSHMEPNGCLPSWFSAELVANPYLKFNGEQGVHIWFLSELYSVTKDRRYLQAAERMATFMKKEILPKQRWLDFETYFSCGVKPMNFKDDYTGQDPRGNVSMSWAAEGFAALYRATGNKEWLEAGEQVIDYLSLYQTVWNPHFIYTAYPFGGTDTDNGDAAWLNGHQAMLPGIFAWYGKELGRQDLLERSVALARASMVLANLKENFENKIYSYPNYPEGLGPENIDHEGIPQTPLRTGGSWCEIGGLTGVSDAMRELGGLYINVEKKLSVGVNGVTVKSYQWDKRTLSIQFETWFKDLIWPYREPYDIEIKVEGLEDTGSYNLVVNGSAPKVLSGMELWSFHVQANN